MINVGDILSTVGLFSTVGDIKSTVGDIMSNVGVILSTVGDIMMHVGGYHEYCGGCSVPWSTQITKDFSPHGTEHPPRYS